VGKIPQNRLYELGIKILNLYPLPNYTPVGNDNFNYRTQASSQTTGAKRHAPESITISPRTGVRGDVGLNTAVTSILPME